MDDFTKIYIEEINSGKYDPDIKDQKLFNLNPDAEKAIQDRMLIILEKELLE